MDIREQLSEVNPDMILWNDMDSAIIGYNPSKLCAVYDIDKMIECCIKVASCQYLKTTLQNASVKSSKI